MKFRLETVFDRDAETILEKYPTIKDLNIEIVNDGVYIILDNLQDLMNLSERCGKLIIRGKNICTKEDTIEIYDGFRE